MKNRAVSMQPLANSSDIENIEVHSLYIAEGTGAINFYFYPELSGNAPLTNVSDREDVRIIPVTVKKLDEFVVEHNVCPDPIKRDVEGAELFVYQDGYEAIKKYRPIISSEILGKWAAKFNYYPNRIIDFLKDLG